MIKHMKWIALLAAGVLALSGVRAAWAYLPLPSSFYGEIHITDGAPAVNDAVTVTAPGVAAPVGTGRVLNYLGGLVYTVDVRGDDTDTPAKDGAASGDTLTFFINGRQVATAVWQSGKNTSLAIHPPDVVVTNTGPAAEGAPVTISAAGTLDWGADIATYAFDCDNNGVYEIGPQAGASAACTFDDGPSSHTVGVRAVDARGGVGVDTTTVTVTNAAPSATFDAPAAVAEGSPINLALTGATDISAADRAAGFTYAFDCGDGAGFGAFGSSSTAVCPTTDNGPRTVQGQVKDKDGGVAAYSASVTVTNSAPAATFTAGSPIVEGASSPLAFSAASDASPADTAAGFHYAFACDGLDASLPATYAAAGAAATGSCPFTDNGTYSVKGRIFDKDDGFTTYTAAVVVNNAAPAVTAPADQAAVEGAATAFNLGAFADVAGDGAWSVAVDWGDASPAGAASAAAPGSLGTLTHAYADGPAAHTVVVTVTDKDGGAGSASFTVSVSNAAPTAVFQADAAVDEGSPISLALVSAADVPADAAAGFTYAFDCGAGFGAFSSTSTASCPTNDNGTRTVRGQIKDKDGGLTEYTANVTINDVLPLADAGGPYAGTAGQPVSVAGTPTCVAVDACTVEWSYSGVPFGTANAASYTWNNIGAYTVVFKVTDNDGNVATANAAVTIAGAVHAVTLYPGWNLVSFNLIPPDPSLDAVLASVAGQYDLVYGWDAAAQDWLKADNLPATTDSLTQLTERAGFWIHITAAGPVTLNAVGSVPTASAVALAAGWNLVGYPAAANRPLPDALANNGVGANFTLVYAYRANDGADPWKLFDSAAPAWANDLPELAPGWGYWVEAGPASTWTVVYLP